MKTHKKAHGFSIKSVIKITGITIAGSLVAIIAFLLITPYPSYSDCFRTLEEIEAYAKTSNELVPMDNNNTLKPEFNNYYKKFIQTYSKTAREKFVWLAAKLGLKKQPNWSISAFKTLLEKATKVHEDKGFQGNVIAKIEGTEKSKCIVFGNIQGALHSLTRDLVKLKELGIIDNNLKIIQPDCYIIFNGDVINRSPYTLESLTVVLKLVTINPGHVVYIRGNHEAENYWQEHTLKTELLMRASVISKTPIPLEKEINRFFNTLPLALYISMPPDNSTDFVRISRFGFGQNTYLEESKYTQFLQKKNSEPLASYVVKDQSAEETEAEEKIKIRVLIKAEKKRQEFQAMEGLRLLPPDKGVTSWNVLSCPTVVYGTVLKFFNDAFVIITAGKTPEDWDVTLYARDRRENKPFDTKKFNFIEGTKDGKPAQEKPEKEKKEAKKPTEKSHEEPEKQVKEKPEQEKKSKTKKDIDKTEKSEAQKPKEESEKEEQKNEVTKAQEKKQESQVQEPIQEKKQKKAEQKQEEKEKITILPTQSKPNKKNPIPIMIITPPNVIVQQVTIPEQEPLADNQTSIQLIPEKKQEPTSQPVVQPSNQQVLPQQEQSAPPVPTPVPVPEQKQEQKPADHVVNQVGTSQQNIPLVLPEQPVQETPSQSVAFSAPPNMLYAQEEPDVNATDNAQQFAQQLLTQSTDIMLLEEPPIEQIPVNVEASPFYR